MMKVYYHLDQLPRFYNCVLTIGSFDGVHHGHQQLIARINRLARQVDGESLIITFHPHPRQVVYPNDKSLNLLTSIDEKVALFEQYGVDNVVVVPFTTDFSRQSADDYIRNFLVGLFRPRYIVIGYDHKFGLGRQGDIGYLKRHAKDFAYEVVEIAAQEIADIAVSSTKIRKALAQGKIKEANSSLGHTFKLDGRIVEGQKIGRQLGYPTANILPDNAYKLIPKFGIYAVKVSHKEAYYDGMLYIGDRPSINGLSERTIEVNIFDFDQQIYGDQLSVKFIDFIRDDAHFATLKELTDQLAKDKKRAKEILSKTKGTVSL